ncbi:MAG: putative DNA binding domain-containing protein [archaeon]|nr:putative DNA binding domain-containing protein [archaeon]
MTNIGLESETVEFKSGMGQMDKGLLGLTAMLNRHNHGTVYIGVDDQGEVVGMQIGKDTLEKIRNRIDSMVLPKCLPDIDILHTEEGKGYIRISCSGYASAYSFNGRYYVRNVTSNVSMTPEMLTRMLLSKGMDLPKMLTAPTQEMTFSAFARYLETRNVHVRTDKGFYESHGMTDADGRFNVLAYLLSDQNNVPMQVVMFEGTDKRSLSHRTDFGRRSLIISAGLVLDHMQSYQSTKVLLKDGARKETDLFDMEAFREAWINACVHNDWKTMVPPSVFVFEDRIEVQSYGSIPFMLSLEEFYSGKSMPVNKSLFDMFILADYSEQSGHGIQKIVGSYGRQSISMGEGIITVTLPFSFIPDHPRKHAFKEIEKGLLNKSDIGVLEYLGKNRHVKIGQVGEALGLSVPAVSKIVSKLKSNGYLVNEGNNRLNSWRRL